MKLSIIVTLMASFLLIFANPSLGGESADAKTFIIAGAGPSTKLVELFAKEFCASHSGYSILVPPQSIKHKGGLEWVAGKGMLFGRTGRPLSNQDKAEFSALVELPMARIKIAFAVNRTLGVSTLSLEQLKGIYTGNIKNWKEVGGPDRSIMLLGREKGESVLGALLQRLTYMADASFVKIYDKDPDIIKAIMEVPGAIGFSTKTEFEGKENLRLLEIEGLNVGLQVGLVYDKRNEDAPSVKAVREFVRSPKWTQTLHANDFLPL